jgi:pimeloyl-ACP methyl ester carboxylesterase
MAEESFGSLEYISAQTSGRTTGSRNALVLHLTQFTPKRSHIRRYQRLFSEDLGLDVLTCRAASPVDVFIPSRGLKLAHLILEFLLDDNEKNGRRSSIVFALYSGASKTTYWPLLKLLRSQSIYSEIKEAVAGQIFDSCPIEFRSDEGLKFLSRGLKGFPKPLSDYVLYPSLKLFSIVLDKAMQSEFDKQHTQYWGDITDPPFNVPTLVISSRQDTIVNPETVQKFCEAMSRRNQKTFESVEFEESSHINHIVKYPREYHSVVSNFVKNTCGANRIRSKL